MPDETTTNYGFIMPAESSLMSDFEQYLNSNWDKISGVVAPDAITGVLPQVGDYKLYDRVYRTDDKSIYILVVKDALWGWHWRPVHASLSPWINIDGNAIYANAEWNNPSSSNLSIAYDNKGHIHWRGFLTRLNPIPYNPTESIFIPIPKGMYPSRTANFIVNPATANVTGAGLGMNQYVRISLSGTDQSIGPGNSSIRLFGGNPAGVQPLSIYLNFTYEIGAEWYR